MMRNVNDNDDDDYDVNNDDDDDRTRCPCRDFFLVNALGRLYLWSDDIPFQMPFI